MLAILAVVSAVFGIIAIGFAAGRSGYISASASLGIADFAFKIAIPALLFHTIVTVRFTGVAPLGVIASFFGAVAVVWLLSILMTRFVLKRSVTDQPSIGITSTFGNTIMLGLPIGVGTFGEAALAPISAIIACHAPILLVSATIHAALVNARNSNGENGSTRGLGEAVIVVLKQLASQPLILAIAVALAWRLTGLQLPTPILAIAEMLARAGVPAALVSLGLSLTAFKVEGDMRTVGALLVLKMLVMPLVAAGFAVALNLPALSSAIVILMAALPAGANAYLFARQEGAVVNAVSGAVALGTALAVVTLTMILVALQARIAG
ncbi:MAG: AEC family transporter [Hyphomicrobiaceae bacterium]|nr:AEC family transporter [Hyphomicrobiaceae bacterium]